MNVIFVALFSHYPWYKIFYSLLNLTAEILNRSDNNNVDLILEQIYNLEMPEEYGAPVEVITPNLKDVRIFHFTCFSAYFSFSTWNIWYHKHCMFVYLILIFRNFHLMSPVHRSCCLYLRVWVHFSHFQSCYLSAKKGNEFLLWQPIKFSGQYCTDYQNMNTLIFENQNYKHLTRV